MLKTFVYCLTGFLGMPVLTWLALVITLPRTNIEDALLIMICASVIGAILGLVLSRRHR